VSHRVIPSDQQVTIAHLVDGDPWTPCPHPVVVDAAAGRWSGRTVHRCIWRRGHRERCWPLPDLASARPTTRCGLDGGGLLLPAPDDLPLCDECAGHPDQQEHGQPHVALGEAS